MAEYPIRSGGTSSVPIGGTAVATILTRDANVPENMVSVRVVWKSNTGATLSDETYTNLDINTVATDGGAITITNPTGDGTYKATYTVPTGVYTPPPSGLQFSLQVIATDEDGAADTGAIAFFVKPSSVTISLDSLGISYLDVTNGLSTSMSQTQIEALIQEALGKTNGRLQRCGVDTAFPSLPDDIRDIIILYTRYLIFLYDGSSGLHATELREGSEVIKFSGRGDRVAESLLAEWKEGLAAYCKQNGAGRQPMAGTIVGAPQANKDADYISVYVEPRFT